MFIRIVSFNGSIIATLVNAKYVGCFCPSLVMFVFSFYVPNWERFFSFFLFLFCSVKICALLIELLDNIFTLNSLYWICLLKLRLIYLYLHDS